MRNVQVQEKQHHALTIVEYSISESVNSGYIAICDNFESENYPELYDTTMPKDGNWAKPLERNPTTPRYLVGRHILLPNKKRDSCCTGYSAPDSGFHQISPHCTVVGQSRQSQRKAGHPGSSLGNRNPASHTLPDAYVRTWQTSSVSPRLSYRLARICPHHRYLRHLESNG